MILIAKRTAYVFLLADNLDFDDPTNFGVVVDTQERIKFPPQRVGSITKMGNWQSEENDPARVAEYLKFPWHGDRTDAEVAEIKAELMASTGKLPPHSGGSETGIA